MNDKSSDGTHNATLRSRIPGSQGDQARPKPDSIPTQMQTELAGEKQRLRRDLIEVARQTFALAFAHVRDIAKVIGFPTAKVRQLWSIAPGFCWLDEDSGYGLQRTKKQNYLLKHIRKVLSVTTACSLEEVCAGLRKINLLKRRAFPIPILEAFCREMGLCISSGVVSSPTHLLPDTVLSAVELGLYAVLRENGGIAHHTQFEHYFQGKSLGANTFEQIMSRSPILLRVEHRVWRQIGVSIEGSRVEEIKRLMGSITPPCDVSDRVEVLDEEIVVAIPVSHRSREKGTGHVPQNWRVTLRGRYALSYKGVQISEIHVTGAAVYGLSRVHRLLGPGANCIRIAFDTKNRTAQLMEAGFGTEQLFLGNQSTAR